MKEIGGFLEFETYYGHEFHEDCIALNNGRNCLRYLIRARSIKRIWLPKLLCSAIEETCVEENVEVLYYSINQQLRPNFPSISDDDWFYLINYYGQYNNEELESYCKRYKNVIVDNAQAFYDYPINSIDTIYTCRKFFGVSDGGYLYTNSVLEEELSQDESFSRLQFLGGRFEKSANEFYTEYQSNEEVISKLSLKSMSKVTHNLLRSIDYKRESEIRKENFIHLHKSLNDINSLNVVTPNGPYMYPLLIKNGAHFRKILQKEKIYIPLLWPNVIDDLKVTDTEYWLADNILPLPCDQRYTISDMDYMLKIIKRLEIL